VNAPAPRYSLLAAFVERLAAALDSPDRDDETARIKAPGNGYLTSRADLAYRSISCNREFFDGNTLQGGRSPGDRSR